MWEPTVEHPLRRLFAGLAEHAFLSHLGVADPPMIDYLSSLLSRFVHFDALFSLAPQSPQVNKTSQSTWSVVSNPNVISLDDGINGKGDFMIFPGASSSRIGAMRSV